MQIYRFSTYHRYFPIAVFFLIAYATLIAFLLQKFELGDFVWWYLLLIIGFLAINHKKQHQTKQLLDSLLEEEQDKRGEIEKSFSKTIKYHLLSSIVFILIFAFAFFYFAGNVLLPSLPSRHTTGGNNMAHFNES